MNYPNLSFDQLENLSAQELWSFAKIDNTGNALFVIGKLMVHGHSDQFKKSRDEGMKYLHQSSNMGNTHALEMIIFQNEKFDKPNTYALLYEMKENLEKVIEAN